jgi:hypothetical protein
MIKTILLVALGVVFGVVACYVAVLWVFLV